MSSLPASISLLWQRRFGPLFGVQFGGALNDNVLRNAVVAMITFGILSNATESRALLIQAALGLFILPFVLFSAAAGRLADDCPDRRLAIRLIKAVEIGTMGLASIGLATNNVALLLLAVFFAGVQSAYFGPFKYAILPELLQRSELIAGNGLLNASTYVAILLGIFWGTELGANAGSTLTISAILLGLAVAGFVCTFWLPAMPGTATSSWQHAWSWRIHTDLFANLRKFLRLRKPALLVAFISWFWVSGAIVTAQLPIYVSEIADAGYTIYLSLLLIVCVGIACGSLLAILILRTTVTTKLVPLGMAISALALFWLPNWEATVAGNLFMLDEFIVSYAAPQLCGLLLVTALGMGFYVVPLYAQLQLAVPAQQRGRVIAANNIVNALFIVLGVVVAGVLIGANESVIAAMRQLFWALGGIGLAVTFLAWRFLPPDEAVVTA